MILANKCDMNDRRQVSHERGAAVSWQLLLSLIEQTFTAGLVQWLHILSVNCALIIPKVCQ